jgi:hypothetical protein
MMGIYKEHRIQVEQIPPITVLMAESAHSLVRQTADESLLDQGLAPGKGMEKQVGADVANSFAYFQSLYGPTRLQRFYVAENPLEHSYLGVAFPGLIHLNWTTFHGTVPEGYDEMLRAHEVAHQWWGALGVVPATYHDWWLAEAFAEFSALRYLEATSKDSKRYLDVSRHSRANSREPEISTEVGRSGAGLAGAPQQDEHDARISGSSSMTRARGSSRCCATCS